MKRQNICLLIFVRFLFFQNDIFSQNGFGIEPSVQSGRIIKHTKNFGPLIPDFTYAIEANFIRQTDGKKTWHQLHNYPVVGLALSYTHYGNDSVLGSAFGVCPNIFFPIIKKEKIEFDFRLGCGLALLTNPFDVLENPGNNVIGSYLNNITSGGLHVSFKINPKLFFVSSISLTHFSNGHFQSPNLGINFSSLNIGIRYFPKPVTNYIRHEIDSLPLINKKIRLNCKAGFAMSDRSYSNGPKYPIYTGSFFLTKLFKRTNNFGIGIDMEYNKGVYDFLLVTENSRGSEKWDAMKIAVFISDEILLGKTGLMGELGVYLHAGFLKPAPFFTKIAIKHYLFNPINFKEKHRLNWFYGIYLKTHYAQAEYFELGTGICF